MVTEAAILDVLRTIDDPEMPVNIVDLGIIDAVRVNAGDDPRARAAIDVDVLPTFVGCPALELIEREIRTRVGRLEGVGDVRVHFRFDPPWTVERISPAGRESLRRFGVTVPGRAGDPSPEVSPRCPFCGSAETHLDSPFGPTRCRMIYYCDACRNSFEHLKRVGLPTLR